MIDYFKSNNLSIGARIQSLMDFELKVNQSTGEELENRKKSAYYKNLVFTITPGGRYVKVQGSLHKFSNNGERNNDRFTFERFLKVADELSQYISDQDRINVIEFGVNLTTPFNPSHLIDNLIAHLKKPFNKTRKQGMNYAQCEYAHFILKIYDKGLQQPTGENILRIEVKYLRMQKMFPDGLLWSSLKDIDTWLYLGEILRKKFSEVIYYDPSIHLKDLPSRDADILKEGRNTFYWQDLKGPHADRTRKNYQRLIRTHGKKFNNLQEILDQEIKELVKSFRNFNQSESMKNKGLVNSSTLLYATFSPTEITSTDPQVCQVTGISISMQRPGSRFLCTAGIRYLFDNDRDLYVKLSEERLSPKWLRYSQEVQFREIAHSIRNEYFNPKNNTKKSLENLMKDPVLFDILSTVSGEKLSLAGLKV